MTDPVFSNVQARLKISDPSVAAAQFDPVFIGDHESLKLDLTGWVVGLTEPITAVELAGSNEIIATAPVNLPSPELAAQYPDQPWATAARFSLPVAALDIPSIFKLRIRAVPATAKPIRLGMLRGVRRAALASYSPRFQPLSVTTIGRTGSTALMRLLAEHPGVVTYRQYPYETRPAKYWLHMLRILSGAPDPAKTVGQPNEFHLETLAVGANPFRPPAFEPLPALEQWSKGPYLQSLISFCERSIDEWYDIVATAQGTPDARYFAEKQFPDEFPPLMNSLYANAKELVLVRDFRDMAASMLAYNDRRGKVDFGRAKVETDADWITAIGFGVNRLRLAWVRRHESAHLVRYEDLITEPATVLTGILTYLELDASPEVVAAMIDRAGADAAQVSRHQTAASTAESIGRWQHDLAPDLRDQASTVFAPALAAFGYAQATPAAAAGDDDEGE